MTYKLDAVISHPDWPMPMTKVFYYHGKTFRDILAQIMTLPNHLHNLEHHKRCAFKDVHGITHKWQLTEVHETPKSH